MEDQNHDVHLTEPTGTAESLAADSLEKVLAECRDVFPIPAPGSPLEQLWAAAMGDPYCVSAYVKAAAGVPVQPEPLCAAKTAAGDSAVVWCYRCGEGTTPGLCRA